MKCSSRFPNEKGQAEGFSAWCEPLGHPLPTPPPPPELWRFIVTTSAEGLKAGKPGALEGPRGSGKQQPSRLSATLGATRSLLSGGCCGAEVAKAGQHEGLGAQDGRPLCSRLLCLSLVQGRTGPWAQAEIHTIRIFFFPLGKSHGLSSWNLFEKDWLCGLKLEALGLVKILWFIGSLSKSSELSEPQFLHLIIIVF